MPFGSIWILEKHSIWFEERGKTRFLRPKPWKSARHFFRHGFIVTLLHYSTTSVEKHPALPKKREYFTMTNRRADNNCSFVIVRQPECVYITHTFGKLFIKSCEQLAAYLWTKAINIFCWCSINVCYKPFTFAMLVTGEVPTWSG